MLVRKKPPEKQKVRENNCLKNVKTSQSINHGFGRPRQDKKDRSSNRQSNEEIGKHKS